MIPFPCLLAIAVLVGCWSSVYAQVDSTHGGRVSQDRFQERYAIHSAAPANVEWVKDPAGSERTVLLTRVRNSDEKVLGGFRTEISPLKEYVRQGVRWYAMSMYLPTDWQFTADHTVIGQLHTSQKTAVVSPPVSFVVRGGDLDLELHFNYRHIEGSDPVTKQNSTSQIIRLDKVRTGQWYCFVVRADWSSTPGEGSLMIWMNGEQVYVALNSYNAYETWLGNWPKVGLYIPSSMTVNERKLYVDFIHVGGAKTGFEQMAALTPCGTAAKSGGK